MKYTYYVVNNLEYIETIEKDVKDRVTIEYVSDWKFITKNISGKLDFWISDPIDTEFLLKEGNSYYVLILYLTMNENTNIMEFNVPHVLGIFDDLIHANKVVSNIKSAIRNKLDLKIKTKELSFDINEYKLYQNVEVKLEKLILKGD